ncbi:MAG: DUF4919 domain-containing protein [Flavobacteriaceae bacterium]|jgi:hypothetical protein|nr:DUF4919 domain-containing protein [Flavobacteriaceae bacterium]
MKNIFLSVILFATGLSFSQIIDLDRISKEITNSESPFFYEKLVEEFSTQPLILLSDSLKSQHLYYGKLYSNYYKKSAEFKSTYLKFMKLAGAKKYLKAIQSGEELLEKDPVNLMVYMSLITCYKNSKGSEKRTKELEIRAEVLMKTIASCGDGKSKKTAFKVISSGDEITLLNYLGINPEKYSRSSEKLNPETILDIWTKNKKYTEDHRNIIYVEIFENISKKIIKN